MFSPFDINKHGEKLHYEIFRILTRTQGSEVIIKARTSTGFSVTEYFGAFGYKETVDFELSALDSDKTVSFILRNDEKLKEDKAASVQFAFLYATQFGDRRIRVFNMSLPVAKNMNSYFKATDVETLSMFILKRDLSKVSLKGSKTTREVIINNLVSLLYNYRIHCATSSSPSQLILPDSLKLLPLY